MSAPPGEIPGRRQRRYADIANTWNVMVENARSIVTSLGPAVERHESLETHVQGLVRFNEQAEMIRSELSSVMKQRRELAREGSKIYQRFTADLHAHHGLDSAELIRYGLQPKGRTRKVSKKKKEEEAAKAKTEAGKVQVEVAPA